MNKIWFGTDDETAFADSISQNIRPSLTRFMLAQVDQRFVNEKFYNLLSTQYRTEDFIDATIVLDVSTEDLAIDEEDVIPVGITTITRPFRLFEINTA